MEKNEERKGELIYEAMAQIMKDTKAISKSRKNQQQGYAFRGIDDVMNTLHSTFAEHGVFILPQILEYEVAEKATARGGLMYTTRAKIQFNFVASDGSKVSVVTVGEAMDSADKSMNKAQSAALKYALMQMLLIPTEEIKDADETTPEATRNLTIAEMFAKESNTELKLFLSELVGLKAVEDVVQFWQQHVEYQTPQFKPYFTQRKNEIQYATA